MRPLPGTALVSLAALSVAAVVLAAALAGGPPDSALELRNLGVAQLENERPAEAESTFRRLAEMVRGDPLPHANLALALLRQQKSEEALAAIGRALALAPGRADLLALRGDILQWASRSEEALAAYRQAAAAAPERVEIQYAVFRQASSLGDDAAPALDAAIDALARLRPENLVILLQGGQRALRRGDRAGATRAFLRVREILWQAPPAATASLEQVLRALEAADLEAARVPALRLENVLRIDPLYQQGLRELAPGVQGLPVERFADEPPPATFGEPLAVRFRSDALASTPTAGRALATGDFDGDERPDLVRVTGGASPILEVRRAAAAYRPVASLPAPGTTALLAADLDNDGLLDLVGLGERVSWFRNQGGAVFADQSANLGGTRAAAAGVVLDFDLEGDLDLALAGGDGGELLLNAPGGPFTAIGRQALPAGALDAGRALLASDLDRDGDPDLLVLGEGGVRLLANLRQGRFADVTAAAGLPAGGGGEVAASADLDADGRPDLVLGGEGLSAWRNSGPGPRFTRWAAPGLPATGRVGSLLAFDADNDGRLDLAAAGDGGVAVLAARGEAGFQPLAVGGAPAAAGALVAADLDGDGDLDLVAAGPAGLHRLTNDGGNAHHWLEVRLRGLTRGSSKNNILGVGATLELRAGAAYQFREAQGDVTHFGLGARRQADLLRVVWTNGVPQNRVQPAGDQRVVEEQLLKGSCPFLYAWSGGGFAFVTDLLWGSPIGLPVAPGVWAGADPDELVRVDGLVEREARYELRVTEELWEAAYFDQVRLWVVDHPREVEVASNLRVLPGRRLPDRVLASRALRPVVAAWDGEGRDATARVAHRDEVYAGYRVDGPYQGVAAPWSFTFDLGEAPALPVRLHLDGWVFPADASLNLAVAQRRDLAALVPWVEVEEGAGWRPLAEMGLPAGKTKTMVLDLPPLPSGARRLRIRSTSWLAWDRIAWTLAPDDTAARVVARLPPASAALRFRGFSEVARLAPNAPHRFDYARVTRESPWLSFPGRFTRYGDVRELLREADDRSVVLGPGDEVALTFDAAGLEPVAPGMRRTLFLESVGWDKDADRNTWAVESTEPLPFRAMTGYPFAPGESYPDTPFHRRYREEWLTREIP